MTWDHYGAPVMLDDGKCALADLFIRTDASAISVTSSLAVLEFEGFVEEYSRLGVIAGATGEAQARTHGNLYFHHRGQRILDILIVRDTTTQTRAGEPSFELVSDDGLVFILDGSVLGICKSGAFMQDILISPAAALETLELFDGSDQWEPDLEVHYQHSRQLIPLQDLLDHDASQPVSAEDPTDPPH
jgi:hypothetical protein